MRMYFCDKENAAVYGVCLYNEMLCNKMFYLLQDNYASPPHLFFYLPPQFLVGHLRWLWQWEVEWEAS